MKKDKRVSKELPLSDSIRDAVMSFLRDKLQSEMRMLTQEHCRLCHKQECHEVNQDKFAEA